MDPIESVMDSPAAPSPNHHLEMNPGHYLLIQLEIECKPR
jgi:hypothetical protein